MPGNAFIKFEKTDGGTAAGESQQPGHLGSAGWIEIADWSWEASADASHLKGTGSAVGKPSAGALSFSHYYDKSSPLLMQFIVRGTHFKTATIDMLKQTGADQPTLFFQISFKDVFITKVSNKGGEDGSVSQDVEFVFKQMALGYKRQNNDGSLAAAQFFRWNIAEMTQDTPELRLSIQ
ncbi:Hcp family type VI secretion system effector [Roseateles amylovorans]|jgi:type VI secretion system secreted protein Hcp|uniref:Type VI secretion system tube protein Hcp n=1 Tax=Roseateles amylovorans TaxID=2978473 RepID=A0ABY6B2S1_9BURK|nr:type VI secretion system tube protein Hcp [Roseateles amylovorans]UXH78516.1 type VI secretion system tube protein Hcp [Roseateles amylovorans]